MALVLGIRTHRRVYIGDLSVQVMDVTGKTEFQVSLKKIDELEPRQMKITNDFIEIDKDVYLRAGIGDLGLARMVIDAPREIAIKKPTPWRFTPMARKQWADLAPDKPLGALIWHVKHGSKLDPDESTEYTHRYGDLYVSVNNRLISRVEVPFVGKGCPHCWNTGHTHQWDDILKQQVELPCDC